jgi:hypothetical protein
MVSKWVEGEGDNLQECCKPAAWCASLHVGHDQDQVSCLLGSSSGAAVSKSLES